MNLTELDEWQGLTSEIVQQWAEAHGYQYRISGLVNGGYVSFGNPLRPDAIGWLVPLLADRAKLSPQAFLREINPRMRKGCPSNVAIQAHDGPWIELRGVSRMPGVTEFGLDPDQCQREWMEDYCKDALFWPCDRHGNKLRWPTDANGEML